MKKVIGILLAAVMVFSFAACKDGSEAGKYGIVNEDAKNTDKVNTEIINSTGNTLSELYVSSDGTNWSENQLSAALPDGESVNVSYSAETKSKEWTIKAVTESGQSALWSHVALGEIEKFALGTISSPSQDSGIETSAAF